MIRVGRGERIWVRDRPTDLRKGYAGLAGLVQQELGEDLISGDRFLFVSRKRNGVKIWTWDGSGLCIYSKHLARGRFAALWSRRDGQQIRITRRELSESPSRADVTRSVACRK